MKPKTLKGKNPCYTSKLLTKYVTFLLCVLSTSFEFKKTDFLYPYLYMT